MLLLAWFTGVAAAQPRVVVSLPPYVDLVQRVAGEGAEVTSLLPAGTSVHAYQPTPRDAARVAGADLVLLNGGLDDWLRDLVASAGGEVATLTVLDALGMTSEAGRDHEAEDDDHGAADDPPDGAGAGGHDHGDVNPHVWLDPSFMRELAPHLAEALADVDPEHAEDYAARAGTLARELEGLEEELRALLEPVAARPFMPMHDGWPHFAARFGLNLVMEIEPFPGREPSPRRLAEAVAALRETGATAVFAESQLSDRAARVLAAEAGVAVYTLDPLGGVPGRETYEALLRYDAQVLREGLGEAAP